MILKASFKCGQHMDIFFCRLVCWSLLWFCPQFIFFIFYIDLVSFVEALPVPCLQMYNMNKNCIASHALSRVIHYIQSEIFKGGVESGA